jgi:hypothetical protein
LPGLYKRAIARLIKDCLDGSAVQLLDARFAYPAAPLLPWLCRVKLRDYGERRYAMYFWTIGHGGHTRSVNEYRIQTKLEGGLPRQLAFDQGTTLLLGYFRSDLDASGRSLGNQNPPDMEVFAAWDALPRLRLGFSSSCQVPLETLKQAYQAGLGLSRRTLPDGTRETVIAFPPRHLDLYLEHASLGHANLNTEGLHRAIGLRELAAS